MPKMIKVKVKDYDHPDYKHLKLTYEIEFDEDDLGDAIKEMLGKPPVEQTQQPEKGKGSIRILHPHTRPIATDLIGGFE